MNKFSHVSFLSDYGTQDEFVGVVKAVIADIAPHVNVIDLVHDVTPFDVRAGSLALARCVPYVPTGVVLAVVDPGVGGRTEVTKLILVCFGILKSQTKKEKLLSR